MKNVILIRRNLLKNLGKAVMKRKFSAGDRIVIKAHLGEYGNVTHVRPELIGVVAEELKKMGTKPFLFDTPTLYRGSRYTPEKYLETAKKNGFTEETIGCPIIISDEGIRVKGKKYLEDVEVAKHIYNANGMVVVSHFKGHPDAGFGGAIKNLGMGGVTKRMKDVEHTKSQPKIIGECAGCGTCVTVCKQEAVTIKNEKSVFNYDKCFGCGACIEACPNKVLKPDKALLRTLLSEVAAAILDSFKPEKLLFINVLLDITDRCDCFSESGKIICPNIGIVVSDDIVSVDKSSLDLVVKTVGKNIFDSISHVNSEEQIEAAIKFGLGPKDYNLEVME